MQRIVSGARFNDTYQGHWMIKLVKLNSEFQIGLNVHPKRFDAGEQFHCCGIDFYEVSQLGRYLQRYDACVLGRRARRSRGVDWTPWIQD